MAWQLLFAIGLSLGWRAKRGGAVAFNPWLFGAASVFLLVCLGAVLTETQRLPVTGWASFLLVPDKTYLSVPRMLHFLALAYVVAMLTTGSRWFQSATARPLVVMGQQALAVFCVGSVLAIMAQVVRFEAGGGLAIDSLLIGCGILAQYLLAEYFAWRKTAAGRSVRRVVAAQ